MTTNPQPSALRPRDELVAEIKDARAYDSQEKLLSLLSEAAERIRADGNICLLCGRSAPCMTDEESLAEGGPGSPCTFEFPLAQPQPLEREAWRAEDLLDKIDGLESELQSAVEVAFKRGAIDWTKRNYPEIYLRLMGAFRTEADTTIASAKSEGEG